MTRADSVDFAEKWEIPIKATKEKIYSIDENLWDGPSSAAPSKTRGRTARRALHVHARDES